MEESPKQTPPPEDGPDLSGYRPAPSRNQKRRSKLKQTADETAPADPEPAAAPPPPPAAAPVRRFRLKRSGQMHDDLTTPLPDEPPAPEEQY